VSLAEVEALPEVAVILAISFSPTAEVTSLKDTVLEPADTDNDFCINGDTLTAFVSLVTLTLAPPCGAGWLNSTVPIR
jgi:hypothetical protein